MSISSDIKLPDEVNYIIKELNANSYKAYIVGGCVRDSILGKQPKDWDISTSATPDEVKFLFNKTIDTGVKHGTVTVVLNHQNIEVTTFRTTPTQNDASLAKDLSLRDLTINSIAFHPLEGLIDPHHGIEDIKNKLIRAVGNPTDRFSEDPLRMIRAVRFSATLGFDIERLTLDAIASNCSLIESVSQERIKDELTKILVSERPDKFNLLRDTGILKHILPEFDRCYDIDQHHPYHILDVARHSLMAVSHIENEALLRWTMLLHDTGKALTKSTDKAGVDHFYGHPDKSTEIAKAVLEKLKFDNKTINKVCHLIKYHDMRIKPDYCSVRKAASKIGMDAFLDLLKVQKADKKSQNPDFLNSSLQDLQKIIEIYNNIIKKQQCLSIKDLKINGEDLLSIGYKQGKEIGYVLNKLLDSILEKPELNTYDNLIELAKSYKCRDK